MICAACEAWVQPVADRVVQTVRCPECGHTMARRFLPLFIVTGPSGVGKSAVVPALQHLMPDWDVFDTDILWDSGGDWNMVKCNWLRIADALLQQGRPTILCGTIQPKEIENCSSRTLFSTIYWLALSCDAETLARRLRARPAWRGCDAGFIAAQQQYARWFEKNAVTVFHPPLTLLDTTHTDIADTARWIRDWAVDHWRRDVTVVSPGAE